MGNFWLKEGTLVTPDGVRYSGAFLNEQLVEGSVVMPNGQTYEGPLVRGVPSGTGKMTQPDGTTYVGEFANGLFNGEGRIANPSGERYEGTFVNGKPHGLGIYFDGTRIERCEYYEGRRIDQAYIIRQENEKQLAAMREERERIAKEKEDQREQARLAAERQAAEEKAERERSSNKLIAAAALGGLGALMGGSVGMNVGESALLGASVFKDVVNEDTSLSSAKQATQDIAASRKEASETQAAAKARAEQMTSGAISQGNQASSVADTRAGGSGLGQSSGSAGSAVASSQAARAGSPRSERPNLLDSVSELAGGGWRSYSQNRSPYAVYENGVKAQTFYDMYVNAFAKGASDDELETFYAQHQKYAQLAAQALGKVVAGQSGSGGEVAATRPVVTTETTSSGRQSPPSFEKKVNLLTALLGWQQKQKDDVQYWSECATAQTYYEEYDAAYKAGKSFDECERLYEMHKKAFEIAKQMKENATNGFPTEGPGTSLRTSPTSEPSLPQTTGNESGSSGSGGATPVIRE